MTEGFRQALVGFGANLGDAPGTLREVERRLPSAEVRLLGRSGLYRTSPVDSSGPDYTNAVLLISTTLSPEVLLGRLLALEAELGRVRPTGVRNAPRTADLDLLLFEGETRSTQRLTLPHPRMLGRLFVLVPLAELFPEWRAADGRSVAELIDAVRRTDPEQRIERLAEEGKF